MLPYSPLYKDFPNPSLPVKPIIYHLIIHYWQKHSQASRVFPMCCPPSLYQPQNNSFSPSLQTFSIPPITSLLSPVLFASIHGTQNWTNSSAKGSQRFTLKTFASFFISKNKKKVKSFCFHGLAQSGAAPISQTLACQADIKELLHPIPVPLLPPEPVLVHSCLLVSARFPNIVWSSAPSYSCVQYSCLSPAVFHPQTSQCISCCL